MALVQHSTIEDAKNYHLRGLEKALTSKKWMVMICYIKEDGNATVDCTTFEFPTDRLDFAIRELTISCDEKRKEVIEPNPPALPLAPHLKLAESFDGAKITNPDGTVTNVELTATEKTPEQIKQGVDEYAQKVEKQHEELMALKMPNIHKIFPISTSPTEEETKQEEQKLTSFGLTGESQDN